MELVIKHFDELTTMELFEIYKLRAEVFVVEQNCAYQDVDDFDKDSYHVYFKDDDKVIAYLRVLPKGATFSEVSIGRLISTKRRSGLGSSILNEGIKVAKERFKAECIDIEAQVYAKSMYEKVGFVQTSEEYLDVGIPHIKMRLEL